MAFHETQRLLLLNFFFLAIAGSVVLIYMYRYKAELKKVKLLQKITKKFEELFHATSEGIFRCSNDGEILTINPAGVHILGISKQRHTSKPLFIQEFITKNDIQKILKSISVNNELSNYELKVKNQRSSVRYINLSVHVKQENLLQMYEGIFHDITEKVQTAHDLERHKHHLEDLVEVRTKQLKDASDKISQHEQELLQHSSNLVENIEAERKRISQDLHDDIGQLLSSMQLNLKIIEQALPVDGNSIIKERVVENEDLLESIIQKVHETALDLRPSLLDDFGLIPTLEWFIERFQKRTAIRVVFKKHQFDGALNDSLTILLYRIIQEAFTNAAKHSKAQNIILNLSHVNSHIKCEISDDGIGFDVIQQTNRSSPKVKLGLIGIRERISSFQGTFKITSEINQGTKLLVTLPAGQHE